MNIQGRVKVTESLGGSRRIRLEDDGTNDNDERVDTMDESALDEFLKASDGEQTIGVTARDIWIQRETESSRRPVGTSARVEDADPDEDDVAGGAASGLTARDAWIQREHERSRAVPTSGTTYERDNGAADLVQDIS
jgi:hypothetical protein